MLSYQRAIPLNACLAFSTPACAFQPTWHTQAEFEIVYIEAGQGAVSYAGQQKRFHTGDILALGPDVPHQYRTSSAQFHSLSVLFRNDFIMPGFLGSELAGTIRNVLTGAAGGLLFHQELVEKERELVHRIMSSSGLAQAAHVLLLLERLAGVEQPDPFREENTRASRGLLKTQEIARYIRNNAHRALRIGEVAEAAMMSRCNFSRFFNRQFGCNFNRFVMSIRVENACAMLREPEKSVSEIAFAAGFDSISSFNRNFLKLKQTSPLRYRREQQNTWGGRPKPRWGE